MEKDFELVFSTGLDYQAETAQTILRDNDIQSFILNKKDSMYQFPHGDIEVYVHKGNLEKAEEILKKLKN